MKPNKQQNKSPQSKTSKTKQFLLTVAEYAGRNLHDLVDLTLAQLSTRDRKLLMHGGIDRVREEWAYEEQRYKKMLITKLKERQWIEERKVGKRILIALTDKGRDVVFKERMLVAPTCQNNECIIVIFDVPEQERNIRRQFRYFLKQCDFVQLQKSVWMHRCDVLTALQAFIKNTKSERWIQVFRAHDVRCKLKW